eukprot:scaffold2858_cov659-Pavlova_lutheri.AAC.103
MQLPCTWPDEPSAARVERAMAHAFRPQKGFRNAWLAWPGVGNAIEGWEDDVQGKKRTDEQCTTCVLQFDSEQNASQSLRTLQQGEGKSKRKQWTFTIPKEDGTSQKLVVGSQQILVAVRRTLGEKRRAKEVPLPAMRPPVHSQDRTERTAGESQDREDPNNHEGPSENVQEEPQAHPGPETENEARTLPDLVPCMSADRPKRPKEVPEEEEDEDAHDQNATGFEEGRADDGDQEQPAQKTTKRRRKRRKKMVLGEEEMQCRKEDPRKWALSQLTEEHKQKLETLKVELTKLLSELHLHGIKDERVLISHLPHVYREKFSRTLKPSDYGFVRLKHVLLEFTDVLQVDESKKVGLIPKQQMVPSTSTMEELQLPDNPVRVANTEQDTGDEANKFAQDTDGPFPSIPQSEFDLLREHHEDMGALESALPYLIDECAVLNVPHFQGCFVDSLTHESVDGDKNSLGVASPGSFTRVQGADELGVRQVVEHARMLTEEELHPTAHNGHTGMRNEPLEDRRNFTSSTDDACKVQEDASQGEGIVKRPESESALLAGSLSCTGEWLVRGGNPSGELCSTWKLFQMLVDGELSSNTVLLHKGTQAFVLARDLFSAYQKDRWRSRVDHATISAAKEGIAWESKMLVEGEPFCDVVASHMCGHCDTIQGFPKVMQLRRQGSLSIADGIAELFRGASRREVLGNVLVLRAKDGTSSPELRKFKSFSQQTADIRRGHTYKYIVHSTTESVVGIILLICPLIPELLGPCNSPRQIDISEETAWKMGYINWKLRSLRQPYMIGLQLPFWEGLVINQLGSRDELVGRLSATGPMAVHMLPNRLVIEKCVDEQRLMQPIEAMLSEGSNSFILHGVTPPDVQALHCFIEEEQGTSSRVFVCRSETSMRDKGHILLTPLVRSNGKNILCGCWCRKEGCQYSIA